MPTAATPPAPTSARPARSTARPAAPAEATARLERLLADPGADLGPRLRELQPAVAAELADKRSGGGVLGQVVAQDPGLASRVAALARDHAAILRGVDRLLDAVDRADADPDAAPRRARALAALVRGARRREDLLVLDAYTLDLGGEGG